MKSKFLTSLIVGLVLPWTYFLVVTVGPVREISESGEVIGKSGVAGFIQFHGFADALMIYAQAIAVCGVLAFGICWLKEAVDHVLKPKL
ncbi:hypothetical protein [Marinobacter shengliensis]|uniref:Uncharacterized protein n=1 Tax=Marinobacter shengliensis TaxID=1389223 RepID=A0ABV4WCE7_9GAMM